MGENLKTSSLPWPPGFFPILELRWRLALGLDFTPLGSVQNTLSMLLQTQNNFPCLLLPKDVDVLNAAGTNEAAFSTRHPN